MHCFNEIFISRQMITLVPVNHPRYKGEMSSSSRRHIRCCFVLVVKGNKVCRFHFLCAWHKEPQHYKYQNGRNWAMLNPQWIVLPLVPFSKVLNMPGLGEVIWQQPPWLNVEVQHYCRCFFLLVRLFNIGLIHVSKQNEEEVQDNWTRAEYKLIKLQYSCNDFRGAELYQMLRQLYELVLLQCPPSVDFEWNGCKSYYKVYPRNLEFKWFINVGPHF